MSDWQDLDFPAAIAVLDGWTDHRVVVSVDLAAGGSGLVGTAGVLRPARHDGRALVLELAGGETWLHLPDGPCFRGASYDPEAQVLVLEFCSDEPYEGPAVLVDVQLAGGRSRPASLHAA